MGASSSSAGVAAVAAAASDNFDCKRTRHGEKNLSDCEGINCHFEDVVGGQKTKLKGLLSPSSSSPMGHMRLLVMLLLLLRLPLVVVMRLGHLVRVHVSAHVCM